MPFAIDDLEGDMEGRYKEVFAGWLGRSYTRLELPDDFNAALANSGVKEKVLSKLRKKGSFVQGIYLTIWLGGGASAQEAEDESVDDEPLPPSRISKASGPYRIDITVVVHEHATTTERKEVDTILKGLREERIPIEKLRAEFREPGKARCSIRELAAADGLTIQNTEVVSVKAWTLHDLLRSVRFTDYDYLSGTVESGDA